MRNPAIILLIPFCLLQLACERQKRDLDRLVFKPPKIVEAKSHTVPLHKTSPPTVIPASGVKKQLLGKPEVVFLKSNVFPAKAKRIVQADRPTLFIPGDGRFIAPKVVPAVDNPFIAGPPEVIVLKEPSIKENNPESFSSIKAMHGLNSNEISSLCNDRAGNIWIGAWWGGVSKYDGRFLTKYSIAQGLSNDVVSCVLEDKTGNMWIGTTAGGVNKFDGRYITSYSTTEGLSNNWVNSILQDKNGDMWFATADGLARYDGHSFTHYTTAQGLPTNFVRSLLEDSDGNLWVGTKGGLTKFDGKAFQNYTMSLGLDANVEVGGIVEDNEGNIWFGTSDGLYKHDGKFISHFTSEGGLSSNRISSIMKDINGDIWIGTWDHGANKYDGTTFTHFGFEQGLGNDVVTAILQDRRGNLWLATTAGVSKYGGKLFSHILPLRQEEVECLLVDKRGDIWIGTGAGNCLNKYDGRSLMRYTIAQGLSSTSINQIIEDRQGNIWFGSRGGVDKYDGKYLTHYSTKNGLIDDAVFCVLEDKNGNLWFGTERGLSKFDGKVFTNYGREQGLRDETIYSLMEDRNGNIWIGTNRAGAGYFNGATFTHFDIAHSLSHPMVLGMLEDKYDNIWFCTGMGINKFNGHMFVWYTTEQGLSNNIVKNALEDKNGNIWIGTINGMNVLRSGPATSDINRNTFVPLFKKYTVSEGFSGGGTYENSLTQDRDGNIWIGGTDRVAYYHPEGDTPDTIPPIIQLSGLALFNENINWPDAEMKKDSIIILNNGSKLKNFDFSNLTRWYNQPQNLELNFDNNYLTFQFIGITTHRPQEVRYQYLLEGLDDHWSNITDQPEATYNNLPPGKYIFKVKAVNSEGYWSAELNYPFLIRPPWWRTWWAYSSYALSFCVMTWMFTWLRARSLKAENARLEEKVNKRTMELEQSLSEKYQLIKKVESQEALLKERLRISRELHDDIGSTLSSISIYSEVAKKRTIKKENANEVLSKIGYASRELIDKMSDIVWSLNPTNENFDQLQGRMTSFAAMMFATRNIDYNFLADEELKKIRFTGEQRKTIFLIFKEALHNIVKYADCKAASIKMSVINNNLMMAISDNGKGFDVSQPSMYAIMADGESSGGNGIKNMHARADDIRGKLCVRSKLNEGTTIELTLPL